MSRYTIKNLLLFLLLLTLSGAAFGQKSVKEMRRRAGNLQKEITAKESILKSSQKDVKSKMQNLELINARIKDNKQLMGLLNDELKMLDDTIAALNEEVAQNEKAVEVARGEYAEALRRARHHATFQDKMLFIVSAKDFNTMVRRYRYIGNYMNAHRKIGTELIEYINTLNEKRAALDTVRASKSA